MQEWLNWPLSKSGMGQLIEGSNPSLSAMNNARGLLAYYFCSIAKTRLPPREHFFK